MDRRPASFCDRCCVTPFVTRRARTAAGRRGSGRSRSRRTCSRSRRSARRAALGEARFVILQDSHIDLVLFFGFLISFSEQAIGAAAGRRLRRRQASSAAGAHVQSKLHVLPATSLARSFLLHAVCAKTFFFLSFRSVLNNQTNSLEVAMGSIACVFFFFCCPFHGLLFLAMCQRYCEQVRLVHLTVLAVPVPQIREQIFDVIKVIPEEWMSKRIVQQIVDVPVPQILEKIVEVVKVILREQCQRVLFFFF